MTTKETKMLKLDLRLRELVEANTHKARRNLELQELSEIPAALWSNWWAGRARPSSEMLMALCIKWPEMSLWLMTGATDPLGGQISPSTPIERSQPTATRYLRRLCEIMDLKNAEVGYDFWEYEVDELGALEGVRKKELERRLTSVASNNTATLPEPIGQYAMDDAAILNLIKQCRGGWTFHDSLRAQFVCLHALGEKRASPMIQALLVGIKSFQEKCSLEDAFSLIASQKATPEELQALTAAKELLEIV